MWDDAAVYRLIAGHLARYRAVALGDVYKLLYQGVLGPEHLIASAASFADRLRAEYAALPAAEDGPLWEEIRPDGKLGRLHLRPFKARGGDLAALVAACLWTAERAWGTWEELREVWALFAAQCRAGRWKEFPWPKVQAFSAWLQAQGYPAVHHSAAYCRANRPAYRLLARSLWPEIAK